MGPNIKPLYSEFEVRGKKYLNLNAQNLSWPAIISILAVKAAGYAIFRGANSQKNLFRRDPTHPRVRGLKTLPTARGTKLIVSGWWGAARHINYFGDWLLG